MDDYYKNRAKGELSGVSSRYLPREAHFSWHKHTDGKIQYRYDEGPHDRNGWKHELKHLEYKPPEPTMTAPRI